MCEIGLIYGISSHFLENRLKTEGALNLVLNPVLNLKPGSESKSVWHLIQLFSFCLMSDTKILTTPVFDHPLLSQDVIILVENLDTIGKSFRIEAEKVFYEIVFVFLVVRGSTK